MKNKIIIAIYLILLSSCADSQQVTECLTKQPCGFWYGLWHGLITPISFICSLFSDSVSVYAVYNSGGWYDFGFLLGIGGLGFGSSKA